MFTGRVLPERTWVTIEPSVPLRIQVPDWGYDIDCVIAISHAQIVITATAENVPIGILRDYLQQAAQALVDAYGYTTGRWHDVMIDTAVGPNGEAIIFGVEDEGLAARESLVDDKLTIAACLADANLRRALADAREAMKSAGDVGFHCYRAVEAIRHHFLVGEDSSSARRDSWEHLRAALRIDRSFLLPIEELALPVRHGETPAVSLDTRALILTRTWSVIERFILVISGEVARITALPLLTG